MHVINVADYEFVSFEKDPVGQNFIVELKQSKHYVLDEQLI